MSVLLAPVCARAKDVESRVQSHHREEEAPSPPDSQEPAVTQHFVGSPDNRVEVLGEPAKVVTFTDQEQSSPDKQYLVIPDDFDFDDTKAVIKLLEDARKNHRSSSRPRQRNNEGSEYIEQSLGRHESAIEHLDRQKVDGSRGIPRDPSPDTCNHEQHYTADWLRSTSKTVRDPPINSPLLHSPMVDDKSFEGLSTFSKRQAGASIRSKARHNMQELISSEADSNVTSNVLPLCNGLFAEVSDGFAAEPDAFILQYRHNDTTDIIPGRLESVWCNAEESASELSHSLQNPAPNLCSPNDASRVSSPVQYDHLLFEIMEDTEDLVLNFDEPSSMVNASTRVEPVSQPSWGNINPPLVMSFEPALSPEQQADDIVKQFQLELVMPPMEATFNFDDAHENATVIPKYCCSCGKTRNLSESTGDEICDTPGCPLFMIPDDAIGAFASATRLDLTKDNDCFDQVSSTWLASPMSPDHLIECYNPDSQSSGPNRALTVEADISSPRREIGESRSIGNQLCVGGIMRLGDDVSMSEVISRMNAVKGEPESQKKTVTPGEETDLAMLIERLASAAKAIQELEQTVQSAESPQHGYRRLRF